jgi:hypothetical protein
MAALLEGRFGGPEQYCADDFELYAVAPVVFLDKPKQRGPPFLRTGSVGVQTANYASDDLELETLGTIHVLNNGERHGDCLFHNAHF